MSKIQQELISSKEAAALIGSASITQFLRDMRKAKISPALKADGIRGAFFWNRADILPLTVDSGLPALSPVAPSPLSPGGEGVSCVEQVTA